MTSSTDAVTVDPSAFDFPGSGSAAVLCLHGLTGTPYEVRPLGEAFARQGIRAFGPALPGHNETPERLARVRHTEWVEAARGHLRMLRGGSERVFVAGMSMGGLVTLALAASEPVDAVITIGTPLRFPRRMTWFLPILKYLRPMHAKTDGSDIRDPAARARHPSYDVMPLQSVHELVRLQRRVRPQLDRVTAPILVAHGSHDRTASPRDARSIHAGVRSTIRELRYFESSGHVVPVDVDGPELARVSSDFLVRHAT